MNYFWIFVCMLSFGQNTPVTLSQVKGNLLLGAATASSGEQVYFIHANASGGQFNVGHYLFPINNQKGIWLNDEKLPATLLCVPVTTADGGWAVLELSKGSVAYLNGAGTVIDTVAFSKFEGYDGDAMFRNAYMMGPSVILATRVSQANRTSHHLVVIDLTDRTMTTLLEQDCSERTFWVPLGNQYLQVFRKSGRLDLISSDFQKLKTIYEIPPQQRGSDTNTRFYVPMLLTEELFSLNQTLFNDSEGKPLPRPKQEALIFSLKDESLRRDASVIVAQSNEHTLNFHLGELLFWVSSQ